MIQVNQSELALMHIVRDRFHAVDLRPRVPLEADISASTRELTIVAKMKPVYFFVEPKSGDLKPTKYFGQQLEIGYHPASARLDPDAERSMLNRSVERITLSKHRYRIGRSTVLQQSVRVVYDHTGKWKAHPPSKRKKMRSWLSAHQFDRKGYQPTGHPGHPGAHRTEPIVGVCAEQSIGLYLAPDADDSVEAMDRIMADWIRQWDDRVVEAFHVPIPAP